MRPFFQTGDRSKQSDIMRIVDHCEPIKPETAQRPDLVANHENILQYVLKRTPPFIVDLSLITLYLTLQYQLYKYLFSPKIAIVFPECGSHRCSTLSRLPENSSICDYSTPELIDLCASITTCDNSPKVRKVALNDTHSLWIQCNPDQPWNVILISLFMIFGAYVIPLVKTQLYSRYQNNTLFFSEKGEKVDAFSQDTLKNAI